MNDVMPDTEKTKPKEDWKPNLYILGARKCGTTSLHYWLDDHPDIFMSKPKEPHYFNTDHNHRDALTDSDYQSYFKGRKKEQVVGESSVWYLYSKEAVPNILKFNSCAKFIVCLRDPVDMVHSLYRQKVFSGDETIKNFRSAWEAQTERVEGRQIPVTCREPSTLLYGKVCSLGAQVEQLLRHVKSEHVYFVTLKEMSKNPQKVYRHILDFLDLTYFDKKDFEVKNKHKERQSLLLRRLVRLMFKAKRKIGVRWGFDIANTVDRYNSVQKKKKEAIERG